MSMDRRQAAGGEQCAGHSTCEKEIVGGAAHVNSSYLTLSLHLPVVPGTPDSLGRGSRWQVLGTGAKQLRDTVGYKCRSEW